MGPTWTHLGPAGPRWAPCRPHEPCYQGIVLCIKTPVVREWFLCHDVMMDFVAVKAIIATRIQLPVLIEDCLSQFLFMGWRLSGLEAIARHWEHGILSRYKKQRWRWNIQGFGIYCMTKIVVNQLTYFTLKKYLVCAVVSRIEIRLKKKAVTEKHISESVERLIILIFIRSYFHS